MFDENATLADDPALQSAWHLFHAFNIGEAKGAALAFIKVAATKSAIRARRLQRLAENRLASVRTDPPPS